MGREKREFEATYRPMPYHWRFWVYSDSCYTEAELNFREWILRARASSGIHSDYLVNPSSWFASDDQALVNVYENAWFYSSAYRTRHVLTPDDFHVQPIDSQRLEWPDIFELMQHVGDYLLLRNQQLPPEQLNQPMSFVLLDVNNMLRSLSQNHNIQQVKEQLELITRYIRNIEKNISPLLGSDRLFLVNFRKMVDSKIQPHLDQKLETQLLRDKLGELSKEVRKLSTERNRVLHFALNQNPVNPHPYEFQMHQISDTSAYPTQAAKDCSEQAVVDPNYPMPTLHLTAKQLKNCNKFQLITDSDEVFEYYSKAISDLSELERFQQVINEISDLLGQAGEVYTVHQFKDQMLTLLSEMNRFIGDSAGNINEIIDANTQAYHKAIKSEQDLSLFRQLFSNDKAKLDTYIKNQDTFSQFPSTSSDLAKTESKLKAKVGEVITHLSNPRIEGSSLEALTGQAQDLNKLIGSMQNWVSTQHILKELPNHQVITPTAPKQIIQIPPPPQPTGHTISSEPVHYPPLFMSSNAQNSTISCPQNNDSCSDRFDISPQPQSTNMYLGLIALIPVGILLFLIVYKLTHKNNDSEEQVKVKPIKGSKDKFDQLITEFEDILTDIQGVDSQALEDNSSELSFILDDYKELLKQADSGIYDVRSLKTKLSDLKEFYAAEYNSSPRVGTRQLS